MSGRQVVRQHPAYRDDIGDLVTRRPLPSPAIQHLDPFLFLNHHGPQVYPPDNRGLPFGPHPHRGFETVTFILSGELSHLDSGGHESIIHAGGVQWMTAGRGLVHAELSPESFKRQGGPLEILQLWVNLPARLKMTEPRYIGREAADIPKFERDGVTIALIAGELEGQRGAIDPLTDITMMTLTFQPGSRIELPVPSGRSIFLYAVDGQVAIGGETAKMHHLVELSDGDGPVAIDASGPATLLFGHAAPFREPIVSHGPFVMNSRDEIVEAVQDYQAGRFGTL